MDEAAFEQVIMARYPAGAGIGRHIDAPIFGEPIVGVSLRGACQMKFENAKTEPVKLQIEPRSLYVMAGESRWDWTHMTTSTKQTRYAITFRTVREKGK